MENNSTLSAVDALLNTTLAPPERVFVLFSYKDVACQTELWWVFLLSSAAIPTLILVTMGIISLCKRISRLYKRPRGYNAVGPAITISDINDESEVPYAGEGKNGGINVVPTNSHKESVQDESLHWSAAIQRAASEIVSAQSITGKVAVVITFVVSMVSLVLYFMEVTNSHIDMIQEKCANWTDRVDWQLELVCSMYLLLDFFIRFIAANNKVKFMFGVYSLVDYFTVPQAFLVLVLNHHWTGLRFLRALYVLSIPDILQYFRLVRKSSSIRLWQMSCLLTGVILVSAGFFHMVETYGDPHLDHSNAVFRSYWDYVYFVVVSMATVGYGEIYPTTRLGKVYFVVFILFAFTVFAACVPEIFRIYESRKRYRTPYKAGRGIRHVIVAGNLNTDTMERFLRVFYCKNQKKVDIEVVFVTRVDPDLEMEALLKRNPTLVFYIQGSVLSPDDLIRAKVHESSACLILADKNASNPTAEDATSVMSVISVKNASPNTRCLVQLLQSRSKTHLRNIPAFDPAIGDSVICFSTLELGLLAQSCLAPGFSTLISNLMSSNHKKLEFENEVLRDYVSGSEMKIFMEQLSSFFEGSTFLEASKICFLKLNILLIGVLEPDSEKPSGGVLLNPSLTIRANHVGIFIATTAAHVSKAWFICKSCHSDMTRPYPVDYCGCEDRKPTPAMISARDPTTRFKTFRQMNDCEVQNNTLPKGWERMVLKLIQQHPSSASLQKFSDDLSKVQHLEAIDEDAGEMAPLSPTSDSSEDSSILDVSKAFYSCVGRSYKSVLLTRSKAAKRSFNDHIVVLVLAGPNDPPIGFQDFLLPLRSSKIRYSDLKEVVLLGDAQFLEREWHKIRSLPQITIVKGDPLDRADLRAVSIKSCAMCVILASRSGGSQDPILDDKDTILATLNIMAMNFERHEAGSRSRSSSVITPFVFSRTLAKEGFEVPTISSLYQDANVPLLEAYEAQKSSHKDVMLMEPFICGYALPLSALDSFLIANFFNPYAIEVINALLFGDTSMLTETLFTEGLGLISGEMSASEASRSINGQLRLISLLEPPLRGRVSGGSTYGILFAEAATHGMVCLGLARKLYPEIVVSKAKNRCVITNPSPTYVLRYDDYVFVLSS